jgi:NAD(P)-dependent dehydrogenase (short-subunit alcohol dehydrogenase family)
MNTAKTVLITGASSGIGKATALRFAKRGWKVAATMRSPGKETDLTKAPNIMLFPLDVTDNTSVLKAFADVKARLGRIDAVVNNAGYGADGVFEAMDDEMIRKQFDTNVFGVMRVTRAAIPILREQGGGTIVQVSSMGGRLAFPLYQIYHGTKWAVEGFTESLQFELKPFNIKLRLIEPGAIKTEFYGRGRVVSPGHDLPSYTDVVKKCDAVSQGSGAKGEKPEVVADAIVNAAESTGWKLRWPVGSPAPLLTRLRKLLPDSWWFAVVRGSYKL